MKIGVVSDSHRHDGDIYEVIDAFIEEEVDVVFHLGDNYDDGLLIKEEMEIPVYIVKGNNDFNPGENTLKLTFSGKSFLITHGHLFKVSYNYNTLIEKAIESDCDCVCFGHTHRTFNQRIDNILLFNPGSLSLPRGDKRRSYGILEVKNDEISGQIKFL